jgi:hypothetical protein
MGRVASSRYGFVLLTILVTLLSIHGCGSSSQKIELKTEYQAVFLDNGQVFFGKAEVGPDFVTVRNVYYIQRAASQDSKEVRNILVKRGQEWHGPEFMHINKRHVVLIEPVAHDSQVAKLINDAEKQRPAESKK